MKGKRLVVTVIIALLLLMVSYNAEKLEKLLKGTKEQDALINNSKPIEVITNQLVYDVPEQSGVVYHLPWVNDIAFKEAQAQSGTPILLASYCAVLRDPLPGEEFNVHLAAKSITGIVVQPGEVFSQNNKIGPYTKDRGYQEGPTYIGSQLTTTVGGGVCKIASTLYNVSILSDLPIIERSNHSMPVPYVPYGQDATVAYGVKDFKFKNDKDFPILIWATGIGNRLYIGFYGAEESPKVEWHHEVLEKREAPKHYKINSELKAGEEKILLEGMDGATIKSYVTVKYPDGTLKTRDLGISFYRPMPYIIEKGKS